MNETHKLRSQIPINSRHRSELPAPFTGMRIISVLIITCLFWGCNNPASDNVNTGNKLKYGTDDPSGFLVVHSDPENGSSGEIARNYEGVYAGAEQEVETQYGWDYIYINKYQFEFVFNNRINMQTLENALSLSTANDSYFYIEEYFSLENHSVKINTSGYGSLIGETYNIHIDTSLQDIYGNRLESPLTYSFTPEPHFRPIYIDVSSPGYNFGQAENHLTKECPNQVILANAPLCISHLYAEFNSALSETLPSGSLIETALNLKDSLEFGDLIILPKDTATPMVCLEYGKEYTITLMTELSGEMGHKLQSPIQVKIKPDSFRGEMTDAWWSGSTAHYTIAFNGRIDSAVVAQNIRTVPPREIEGFIYDADRLEMEVNVVSDGDQFDSTVVKLLPFVNPDGYMLADTVTW